MLVCIFFVVGKYERNVGYEQLLLSSPNRKVLGAIFKPCFQRFRTGSCLSPCSTLGSVFQGAVQKSCGYCFFKGLSSLKRAPANDYTCEKVWEDWITGSTMTCWMNWCPSMILVNRLLIVLIRTKIIRSSSSCLTLFSKIKTLAFCITSERKQYF